MGEQAWLHGAMRRTAASYPRCDSSECLLCQSAAHEMCRENQAVQAQRCPSGSPCATEPKLSQAASSWQGQRVSTPRRWGGWCGWQFDSALDTHRTDPAPAQLMQVAELALGPAQFVNALEFSQDGWLLATGSCMRKEVRLYNIQNVLQASFQPGSSSGRAWSCDPQTPLNAQQRSCLGTGSDASDDTACPSSQDVADASDVWAGEGTSSSTDSWWDSNTQASYASIGQNSSKGNGNTGSGSSGPAPVAAHRLPGKVSCVTWSPALPGVICVGDYDGVITQLHVATGHQLRDIDEHGGKRIWSLAHSQAQHAPLLCASASDDGTARLWGGPCMDSCVAVLRPGATQQAAVCSGGHGPARQRTSSSGICASVCGVDFSHNPTQPYLLALACADHAGYVYDIRRTEQPLHVLSHHTRPVSYAKFFGPNQLVTASTDGSLAVWDLSAAGSMQACTAPQPMDGVALMCSQPDLTSHVQMAAAATAGSLHALQQPLQAEHQPGHVQGGCCDDSMLVDDDDENARPAHADLQQSAGHHHSCPAQRVATHACTCGMHMNQQQQGSLQGWQLQGSTTADAPAAQVHARPWKIMQGHKNERNFVGLAVRPEDGLMACGSETSQVYTYHRAWATPLAVSELLPAGPAVGGSQAGVAAWQLPGSSRCTAVATWKQQSLLSWGRGSTDTVGLAARRHAARLSPDQFHRFATTSLDHTPSLHGYGGNSSGCSAGPRSTHAFVSSVAWQPAAAGVAAGLPPLLAAGTSAGTVKLLALERPRA